MWNLFLFYSNNIVKGQERSLWNTNKKVGKHWDKDVKVGDYIKKIILKVLSFLHQPIKVTAKLYCPVQAITVVLLIF